MIGKRIGLVAITFVIATILVSPSMGDDDKAKAGVIVSITEDFLMRGQNELLQEFVDRANTIGEEAVYEVDLQDLLKGTDTSETTMVEDGVLVQGGQKLKMSQMKILNVGNMLSGAEKTINLRADCHCV